MIFSDYFNYLSNLSTVTALVALLFVIPLGLFLCKYNTKFIAVSLSGLAFITVYLSQSIVVSVNLLALLNHNAAALLLQYVLPLVFFLITSVGITRYGLQIWTNHSNTNQFQSLSTTPPNRTAFKEQCLHFLRWFITREGILICVIATVVLTIHIIYIANPKYPIISDETYYVQDAIKLLHGQPTSLPEHPPLGKWMIASGVFIFGNNPVGWRAFSIIFGIISIFIFYRICKRLTAKWPRVIPFVPMLATFLLAFENLTFVMGHAAMLDVFYVTFMLLGFLLYLRGNYLSCGLVMGLSLLCKETAILPLFAIILHWIIIRRSEISTEIKYIWNTLKGRNISNPPPSNILIMFKLLTTAIITWCVLLAPLEYSSMHQFLSIQGYPLATAWFNPLSRAEYILWHVLGMSKQSVVVPGSMPSSVPLQWILRPTAIRAYSDPNFPRYLISIGWTILVLIIPSLVYLIIEGVKHRTKGPDIVWFLLPWLTAVYLPLVIIALLTNRTTYEFYFYPSIPAACMAIAWGIWKLWGVARRRPQTKTVFLVVIALYLLGTIGTFVIMSPLGTNLVKLPF